MFRHITGRYDYLELEKILAIEDAYDVRSVFFWLTERGRGRNGIENADYHIDDPAIRKKMQLVSAAGGSNGLHKSAFTNHLFRRAGAAGYQQCDQQPEPLSEILYA